MPSQRLAKPKTDDKITTIAELKKAVANLNPEVKTIDEPVASAFFEGIKLSFEEIVKFEAGLREKAPKAEYHDDLEHEWWSCSRCGLTGSEDEICGHVAGWDCARELRMILGEGDPR